MTSIFSKVRVIVLGNVHTILDKAIDMNKIASVEQYVRDLQDARKDLEGELAEQKYSLTVKQNNLASHKKREAELVANIQRLGDVPASKTLAVELLGLRKTIVDEEQMVVSDQDTVTKLTTVVAQVNQKEAEMQRQLGTLRAQESTAKAKTRAADAIERIGAATEAGGSVDSMVDSIGRQAARADAQLDRAVAGIQQPSDAEADALLASILKK